MPRSLISLTVLLAALAAAQQPAPYPDSGVIAGPRYVNGYFGFSYRFPEGWKPSAPTHAGAMDMDAASRRPASYFTLFSAAPGSAGAAEVRYISIQADLAPAGISNGREFLAAAVRNLTGNGGVFEALREQHREYGGHTFFREDLRSRPQSGSPLFLETELVTMERGYAITLSFVAGNRNDLDELVRSAESLEFFAPGSLPQPDPAPAVDLAKAAPAAPEMATATPAAASSGADEPVTVVIIAAPGAPGQSPAASAPAANSEVTATNAAPAAELAAASNTEAPAASAAPAPAAAATQETAAEVQAAPAAAATQETAAEVQAAPAAATAAQVETVSAPLQSRLVEPAPAPRPEPAMAVRHAERSAPANLGAVPVMGFASAPRVVAPAALSQPLYAAASFRSEPEAGPLASPSAAPEVSVAAGPAPLPPRAAESPAAPAMMANAMPAPAPEAAPLRLSAINFVDYIARKTAIPYPPLAREQRIQGEVVLKIVLDASGKIAELAAISGPLALRQGAVEGVRSWSFRPYRVEGKPVNVQSQISLAFRLQP